MVVIEVSNLNFSYENTPILNNISFSARSGEVISIIGPNGSGKSTLLKLLCRNLKPNTGVIKIDGVEVEKLTNSELSTLQSILPQNTPPIPMTVIELVLIGRVGTSPMPQINQKELEVVESALKKLEAIHLMNRNIVTLSGGERKIAYIGMVISRDSKILLLDEPTAHLDYKYALKVMETIRMEGKHDKLVIMAMHDLILATRYSDRLILLSDGKIINQGDVCEVTKPEILKQVYGVNFEILRRGEKIEAIIPIS
ncbi:MAG: ABC transporter ATP-binding protein [Candidatus Odinarchaeia archaeon]